MRFRIVLLFLAVLSLYVCVAQPPQRNFPQRFQRVEALKKVFVSQQLNLTEEELQQFWPVYNMYMAEMKTARKQNLQDEIAFEEMALEIRKRYRVQFQKQLGAPERVNKVYGLERNFRNFLRKELEQRQLKKNASPQNAEPTRLQNKMPYSNEGTEQEDRSTVFELGVFHRLATASSFQGRPFLF